MDYTLPMLANDFRFRKCFRRTSHKHIEPRAYLDNILIEQISGAFGSYKRYRELPYIACSLVDRRSYSSVISK